MKNIKIGSGAGYGGDRIEPAIDLIERADLDYISFECLAERTIAIAMTQKRDDPAKGYNELLEWRFEKILPALSGKKTKVITNMGAANPDAAAKRIAGIAGQLGIAGMKIASVTGDDVGEYIKNHPGLEVMETGLPLSELSGNIVSANAYCGAAGILKALETDAQIIITGRVADPALFLAPLIHEFGWSLENWDKLGTGTVAGHLLECSSQVSGGYFADPGRKDVPDLWKVGFPYAVVGEDGSIQITKLPESGGMVTAATVKEQLLYEIHNPAAYLTPDVTADFSAVTVEDMGSNIVKVVGATGHPKTGTLKVSVGYEDGYIGEGEISYGGPGAYERARLAGDILVKRLEYNNLNTEEVRVDLMGVNSLYGESISGKIHSATDVSEVRLRLSVRTKDRAVAVAVGNEVEALYLNGPYGGGGVRKYLREIMSVASVLIDESQVSPTIRTWEV